MSGIPLKVEELNKQLPFLKLYIVRESYNKIGHGLATWNLYIDNERVCSDKPGKFIRAYLEGLIKGLSVKEAPCKT